MEIIIQRMDVYRLYTLTLDLRTAARLRDLSRYHSKREYSIKIALGRMTNQNLRTALVVLRDSRYYLSIKAVEGFLSVNISVQ
jgi:hypothetical protein